MIGTRVSALPHTANQDRRRRFRAIHFRRLEDARRIIASTPPYLIIELNDNLLREVGQTRAIIADSLREQAYRIFAIGPKDLCECQDVIDPVFSEILCVPSDRLEESSYALPTQRTKH